MVISEVSIESLKACAASCSKEQSYDDPVGSGLGSREQSQAASGNLHEGGGFNRRRRLYLRLRRLRR